MARLSRALRWLVGESVQKLRRRASDTERLLYALDKKSGSVCRLPGGELIRAFQVEHKAVAPKHYADKSHPNIWHAEDLAAAPPDAIFLGIRRNPYATVASMLKHRGVFKWHARWRRFPVPNRFLGITPENRRNYANMPLPARCVLRWRSHIERLGSLRGPLGNRLLVVDYEDLIRHAETELAKMNGFLGLTTPSPCHPSGRNRLIVGGASCPPTHNGRSPRSPGSMP